MILSCKANFGNHPVNMYNSLNKDGLKGKIKSITEFVYHNFHGQQILMNKYFREFDDQGNEVLAIDSFEIDGMFETSHRNKYNHDYKYNKLGLKIKDDEKSEDDNLLLKTEYTYDKKGYLVAEEHYSNLTKIPLKIIYKNDAFGFDTGLICMKDGETIARSTFKYDLNGNVVEETGFDSRIPDIRNLQFHRYWKYDNKGILNEFIEKINDTEVDNLKYFDVSLDDHGNWIQRNEVERFGGRLLDAGYPDGSSIKKREIIYYQ